ncbi:MAG: DUF5655 domain-containing protein [Myxococcota bacterium]|nr:DUF5655 domain-containing protein [Myxococcota bacterium]
MKPRIRPEPQVVVLSKALQNRIDDLPRFQHETKESVEVYRRNDKVFLQVEIKRDHILVDLWLPPEETERARTSGLGRGHPFWGNDALRIRFEQAVDLAQVARWIEQSYDYAPTVESNNA